MEIVAGKSSPLVCILLATYNGERFIENQILSIINQSHSEWILLIRDDGSTDNTCNVCNELAGKDSRIRILETNGVNLGACGNFEALIHEGLSTNAHFFAFADQDDLWLENKLERHMQYAENARMDIPYLAYTDPSIIDVHGNIGVDSFMTFQGLHQKNNDSLSKLLLQNYVVGASMVGNRHLLALATPFPRIHMHDWWLALLAQSYRQLEFIPENLMRYRLHDANTCGAAGAGTFANSIHMLSLARIKKMARLFSMTFIQASALQERIKVSQALEQDQRIPAVKADIRRYLNIRTGTLSSRMRKYHALPYKHDHLLSRIFWMLCLLIFPRKDTENTRNPG